MPRARLIEVGYVARAHGVRGELRVVTHDPDSDSLDHAPEVYLRDRAHPIERARPVPGAWLVKLEGVDDRNAADALRGVAVAVDRAHLSLEEGEVFLSDLIGCRVELPGGAPWGEVVGIDVGPQERLIIHHDGLERLLPYVSELIVEVDVDGGRLVVDPPADWPEAPVPRSR